MITFTVGQHVIWLYEMSGGEGYVEHIDAVVIEIKGNRVKIEVPKRTGKLVHRWVKAWSLRALKTT